MLPKAEHRQGGSERRGGEADRVTDSRGSEFLRGERGCGISERIDRMVQDRREEMLVPRGQERYCRE